METIKISELYYFSNVRSSLPAVNDTECNSTMLNVGNTFYSATILLAVSLIVMAAIFILSVVSTLRGAGGGGFGGGGE